MSVRKISQMLTKRQAVVFMAVIAACILLVYAESLSNDPVTWDDNRFVYEDPDIRELSLRSLAHMFLPLPGITYIPLTTLTFQLEHSVTKLVPFYSHAISLLLHLANALLVFWLARALSGKKWVGFLCGLLFGLHTLHTEPVAWISGRKDLLAAFFSLLCLLAYQHFIRSGKRRDWALSLMAFALALLSKPTPAPLPFILLLLDYKNRRGWSRPVWMEKLPFFACSLLIGGIAAFYTHRFELFRDAPFPSRLAAALLGLSSYLGKLILPVKLSPMVPYPAGINLAHPGVYPAAIFLAAAAGLAIASLRRTREIAFGMGFFLVLIGPSLWKASPDSFFIADRFLYLPSFGLFYLFSLWVDRLVHAPSPISRIRNGVLISLTAGLLIWMGGMTRARSLVWKTSETLYLDTLKNYPDSFMAHNNLGNIYARQNKTAEAIREFETALGIRTDQKIARFNLAYLYEQTGERQKALNECGLLLGDRRGLPPRLYRRTGILCMKLGLYGDAAENLSRALASNPGDTESARLLGILYGQLGMKQTAVRYLKQALALNPADQAAQEELAHLMAAH